MSDSQRVQAPPPSSDFEDRSPSISALKAVVRTSQDTIALLERGAQSAAEANARVLANLRADLAEVQEAIRILTERKAS